MHTKVKHIRETQGKHNFYDSQSDSPGIIHSQKQLRRVRFRNRLSRRSSAKQRRSIRKDNTEVTNCSYVELIIVIIIYKRVQLKKKLRQESKFE